MQTFLKLLTKDICEAAKAVNVGLIKLVNGENELQPSAVAPSQGKGRLRLHFCSVHFKFIY